jgi:hypothetical protein
MGDGTGRMWQCTLHSWDGAPKGILCKPCVTARVAAHLPCRQARDRQRSSLRATGCPELWLFGARLAAKDRAGAPAASAPDTFRGSGRAHPCSEEGPSGRNCPCANDPFSPSTFNHCVPHLLEGQAFGDGEQQLLSATAQLGVGPCSRCETDASGLCSLNPLGPCEPTSIGL